MRVNPQYITNLVNSLDGTTSTQQQLTQELATGLRVNSLSDDPVAAGQNVLLTSEMSADVTFSQTASSAESMLQVGDSALGSVVSQLTAALSLATGANNGTNNGDDLKALVTQLTGIRDEVLSLANTTYQGQYIFGGSISGTPPFALDTTVPAGASYAGDDNVNTVQTPNGQSIQVNVPGDQIFLGATGNVLGTLNALIADYSSGTVASTATADTKQLSQAISTVSQQRVVLDNSITRLTDSNTYSQTESTQLASVQNDLIQAGTAEVSSQLSMSETQQTALIQVIAAVEKQGTLFNAL